MTPNPNYSAKVRGELANRITHVQHPLSRTTKVGSVIAVLNSLDAATGLLPKGARDTSLRPPHGPQSPLAQLPNRLLESVSNERRRLQVAVLDVRLLHGFDVLRSPRPITQFRREHPNFHPSVISGTHEVSGKHRLKMLADAHIRTRRNALKQRRCPRGTFHEPLNFRSRKRVSTCRPQKPVLAESAHGVKDPVILVDQRPHREHVGIDELVDPTNFAQTIPEFRIRRNQLCRRLAGIHAIALVTHVRAVHQLLESMNLVLILNVHKISRDVQSELLNTRLHRTLQPGIHIDVRKCFVNRPAMCQKLGRFVPLNRPLPVAHHSAHRVPDTLVIDVESSLDPAPRHVKHGAVRQDENRAIDVEDLSSTRDKRPRAPTNTVDRHTYFTILRLNSWTRTRLFDHERLRLAQSAIKEKV